jgi:antitoxin component YwqK of YwqJK toxin-antitoxin module
LHGLITFWDEEGNFLETQKYENGELLETSTIPPDTPSEESNAIITDNTATTENNNDAASLNTQLKESFHDNGVKKMEAHYVDGKLNGSSTLWNEYGQKIIIVNYKEDKRHGLLTRWHNSGQKKIEINYIDNKRDGEMTFWNENGDVKKILTYSNGELIEKEKEYD